MREIILISFLGPDQPNQFTRLMQVLSVHSLQILDVGQAVIHNQLTLGIVVASDNETATALAMKEILILAHDIGLTVRFKPISNAEYDQWVSEGGRTRYIVTALAPELTAAHLQAVTKIVSSQGFNIETVTRLSGRLELDTESPFPRRACVQFGLSGQMLDAQAMRAACLSLSGELNIDVAVQEDNAYRRNRRLVCFDMDSTLIEQEVIDELALEAGVGEQVAEITERAMLGELDFQQSFRARVALLKGLDASVLPKIAERLTVTEGAERLISTLKALGYKTAILSGGFQYFAEYLQAKLGIDEVHANILDVENGIVTGEVKGAIVDGARKAELLRQLAEKMGISLEQAMAVGDGANDLPMLSIAGLGVAFRAKPLVRQNANQAISSVGLDGVLYLLGMHDKDLNRA
ncbi:MULTISPECIES: phosphoserine phosphatase SerB [Acinetobacter]|jgi:phosphoserine phosphatase|uniref:phosphoserine phosphatase SerB n=1 Tax=Acinetobacter TaxID=469 RepID=UPI000647560A|nr:MULTISPECIES: phosphoserine phosphatase SerB [Acinetobacter]KYQ82987.1 phosphoserine phosphatase [Acinetobacter sp. NRRL B-65365]MBJ8482819.1 phosphoserine phosphatase SerB [Acinetobacter vivianii]MEB6479715.1 phosphoserine phosphatase SerB [Acinetobacter vivianii]MEB6658523.1 phosphoserine phosphatase SerB [Acinetobacter vivianii]MEB6667499.1 phosphoserine phosphatase SerB [Acinetobacter vivianii]